MLVQVLAPGLRSLLEVRGVRRVRRNYELKPSTYRTQAPKQTIVRASERGDVQAKLTLQALPPAQRDAATI